MSLAQKAARVRNPRTRGSIDLYLPPKTALIPSADSAEAEGSRGASAMESD